MLPIELPPNIERAYVLGAGTNTMDVRGNDIRLIEVAIGSMNGLRVRFPKPTGCLVKKGDQGLYTFGPDYSQAVGGENNAGMLIQRKCEYCPVQCILPFLVRRMLLANSAQENINN